MDSSPSALFIDDSVISHSAQILANVVGLVTQVVPITDQVKGSDVFKTASPKGELPALSGANVSGIDVLRSIVTESSPLLGSSSAKAQVDKMLTFISKDFLPLLANKGQAFVAKLHKLNKDLITSTFFVGNSMTVVDVFFFVALHPVVSGWNDNERVDFMNITRWFDFIQHQPSFSSSLFPSIAISKNVVIQAKPKDAPKQGKADSTAPAKQTDAPIKQTNAPIKQTEAPTKQTDDAKSKPQEKKEQGNKGKEEVPAKGQQEKKAKGQAPAKAAEPPMDVSRLDIRVGKIINVKKHESADTLYVEEIDLGEEKPRQVVSGLVKFVPIEEMKDREVLCLCNLKAANMRGVKSEAMVLCASNDDHTQVEFVTPPSGCKLGERVTFPGFPGAPDSQLNPKHKVWETIQPDLKTDGDRVATYKGAPFTTSAGTCTVKSITNGGIK